MPVVLLINQKNQLACKRQLFLWTECGGEEGGGGGGGGGGGEEEDDDYINNNNNNNNKATAINDLN
jgi:hypothetical protein